MMQLYSQLQLHLALPVSFPDTCKGSSSKAGTGSYSYWQLLAVTIHTYSHSPVEVLYVKMDSKSILAVIGRYCTILAIPAIIRPLTVLRKQVPAVTVTGSYWQLRQLQLLAVIGSYDTYIPSSLRKNG
jgi:hypothetical protein